MTEAAPPKTAITICGSLRKDSINEPLRRHLSAKLREAGVIVTDLDMPEQDGFHFVASLRADSAHADIPVIALASGVNRDAIEHGRKLRISDVVAKFDRSGLLAALAGTQDALGEAA